MIEVQGLGKQYGKVQALTDIDLQVPTGTVMCLLGHNGAGKTTLVQILATLASPTCGRATVAGFDVQRQGHDVRRRIGITGQFASLDERLSGVDNLVLVGRLLGAGKRGAHRRAMELLELFNLTNAGDRLVGQYSGGMRRRLDVAASLVGQPAVVFLDEPTTGLDPVSRAEAWSVVRELTRTGTTVLLTTQDLEEADRLADRITVLASGRAVASGTPSELKNRVGKRAVVVTPRDEESAPQVAAALAAAGLEPATDSYRSAVVVSGGRPEYLMRAIEALEARGVEVSSIALAEPTLHDVYLALAANAPSARTVPAEGGRLDGRSDPPSGEPGSGTEPATRRSSRRSSRGSARGALSDALAARQGAGS